MRMIKILTLAGFVTMALFAQTTERGRLAGFCEDGNQQVSTVSINSTTRVQRSFPSCTVTVWLPGTTTLATIYSDNNNTPKANPFTASSTGYWFFYADDGKYDVNFSGGGISSPFTLGDQMITDPKFVNTLSTVRRSLVDKVRDVISVKDYGAVGDGSTNNSTFITNAVTAACSTSPRTPAVYFPAGQYNISTTIALPCALTIYGDGPTESTIFLSVQSSLLRAFTTDFSLQMSNIGVNTTPLVGTYLGMTAVARGFGAGTSVNQRFVFTNFRSVGFNFGLIISGVNNDADKIDTTIIQDSYIQIYTAPGAVSNPVNCANTKLLIAENNNLVGDGNADHAIYCIAVREVRIDNNYIYDFDHSAIKLITGGFGGGSCPASNTDYTGWTISNNTIQSSRLAIQAETYCSVILPAITITNNQILDAPDTYAGDFAPVYIQANCQSVMNSVQTIGNSFNNIGLGAIRLNSSIQFPQLPCPSSTATGTIANYVSIGDSIKNYSQNFSGTFAAISSSSPNNLGQATITNLYVDGGGTGGAALSIEFPKQNVYGLTAINTSQADAAINPALDIQQNAAAIRLMRVRLAPSPTGAILDIRDSANSQLGVIQPTAAGKIQINMDTTPGVFATNDVKFPNARIVIGSAALVAGTLNVDFSTPWSSGSSYRCTANESTSINPIRVSNTDADTVRFDGTGSDTFGFICVGN